ncbi:Gfo/Idh/MocA family oxidoreductase, partial [Acidobacteria bacterium AH-259-G07]|nr:Gfo/Idh/MocA family oxidoreductase [Acidobacteria bacterium AH-259-G07]
NLLSLRGCQVVGLFDTDIHRLQEIVRRFSLRPYASEGELFSDESVEAVVLSTPSHIHREQCLKALEANKHVFVEKPLASNMNDAQEILRASEASRRVVQVGFCERCNVNYLEAKRAIDRGRLGRIRAIQTSRFAPYDLGDPTWDLGILDVAVHNLDLILWLTGRFPTSVFTKAVQVYRDSSIPHAGVIILNFEDGSFATDHIYWVKDREHPLSHCARSRMFIQGEEGCFEVDLTTRPSSLLDQEEFRLLDSLVIGGPEYSGCLKLQFEYFLRSIEEGAEVVAPVADAVATQRLVEAAFESLQSGIEVPLVE